MSLAKTSVLLLLAAFLLPLARGESTDFAEPLVPASGTGTETLLIADADSLPFSLLDVRAVIRSLLSRISTTVHDLDPGEVTSERLAKASYVVLVGTGKWPDVERIARLARAAGKPVLAIGAAAVANDEPAYQASVVLQRGAARFRSAATACPPARLPEGAETLATITGTGPSRPLAWREGADFYFAALPTDPATGFVFSDVVLDFYDVQDVPASGVLLVVEGVARGGDPTPLRRLTEEFFANGWPFLLSVDAPVEASDPVTDNTFFSTLRFVQSRGGRVILSVKGDFWDGDRDQSTGPAAMAHALTGLERGLAFLVAGEVFPLGLRLPDSGLGRNDALAAAGLSRVAVGTLPVSDVTASLVLTPGTPILTAGDFTLLPASIWFDPGAAGDESWQTVGSLLKLRGMVMTVRIPAWWPLAKVGPVVQALKKTGAPVLNVLQAPVAMTTSGVTILGRNARPVPWPGNDRLRLRLFDAEMNLLSDTPQSADGDGLLQCPDTAAFLVAEPVMP